MSPADDPDATLHAPASLAAQQTGEAALRAGRLVEAARRADALVARAIDPLTAPPTGELRRAGAVLAAVRAHRGMLVQAAELHRWTEGLGAGAAAGVVATVGTGTHAVSAPEDLAGVPTLGAGAELLVARGVVASVRPGGSGAALADLTRASAALECRDEPVVADESPAALGALVALARGEADLAHSLLERAIASDLGGPALRRRHRLLRAWAHLAAGDLAGARAGIADAAAVPGDVEVRDQLLGVALEAGVARRSGDHRTQQLAWPRAGDALLRHGVDLWALLPLGELVVCAARRRGTWLAGPVADAEALLARLGHPPLWTAPWRWQAFAAALLVEDLDAARDHARRLDECAADAPAGDSLARPLAEAARRWLAVLGGEVDTDAVTASAAALRDAGLAFDGAHLAKDAAVRVDDRRTLTAMLGVARAVLPAAAAGRPDASDEDGPDAEDMTATDPAEDDPGTRVAATHARRALERAAGDGHRTLSAREAEVATLLLEGMTYREVGERLFISAKTVEHHVGRIRQRLGSGSRTELFADLREALTS